MRIKEQAWCEIFIPNPSVAKDLYVAISWAEREAEKYQLDKSYDDWLEVIADDEEIVFRFEIKS